MDFIVAVFFFLSSVLASLLTGCSTAYGLFIGYICFVLLAFHRKFSFHDILKASLLGIKNSFIVLRVILLIGILTAMWRMNGTIAYSTYYGVKLIPSKFFVLSAFLVSSIISYAIGSCVGVASTVGVIIISVARSGGVNVFLAAGAIMSGAYFGDRSSPVASSASLVAAITHSNLYENIKRMMKTSIIPLIICSLFYGITSFFFPLISPDMEFLNYMKSDFRMTPWLLLPILITLVLPVFRIDVKITILISTFCAAVEAFFVQQYSISEIINCAIFGFYPKNMKTGNIFSGGGVLSMSNIVAIMLISGAFSKIFDLTGCLNNLQNIVSKIYQKFDRYTVSVCISVAMVASFCSQTIAAIMLKTIIEKPYLDAGASRGEIALDISNSAILISSMIPWSLSVAGPMKVLQVDARMIPLTLFLFTVPICYRFSKKHIFPIETKE